MQNVRESQLKKCIFLTKDEFQEILETIYEAPVVVHPDLDGIWYESSVEIDDANLLVKLKEYYDVKEVTSIHCDDCDYVGIWVCYKD